MEDEKTNKPEEITQEELKERQAKRDAYLDIRIPQLEKELKYEKLLADMAESRYRGTLATIRHAQLLHMPEDDEQPIPPVQKEGTLEDPIEDPGKPKRTLKEE